MEKLIEIINQKLRDAYYNGYSDCENTGMNLSFDEYISTVDIEEIKKYVKEYTESCIMSSLQKASENAEADQEWEMLIVKSESITNENNIVLL